jgi:hypothetical protein
LVDDSSRGEKEPMERMNYIALNNIVRIWKLIARELDRAKEKREYAVRHSNPG